MTDEEKIAHLEKMLDVAATWMSPQCPANYLVVQEKYPNIMELCEDCDGEEWEMASCWRTVWSNEAKEDQK